MDASSNDAFTIVGYLSSILLIRKNIQECGADIIINFYEVLCPYALPLL